VDKVDLEKIAESALNLALKSGASEVESFVFNGHMKNVYVENSEVRLVTNNSWIGLGVKTVLKKKIGFASGYIYNDESANKVVQESIKLAKVSPEDPNFVGLPNPTKPEYDETLGYDKETEHILMEDLISFAQKVISAAESDKRVKVMNGLLRVNSFEFSIKNSHGLSGTNKGTFVFLHFTTKSGEAEGVKKAYSSKISDINFRLVGEELRKKTLVAREAVAFKGKEILPTIIIPEELEGLFNSTLTVAVSGENVNKKRSPWTNKLNEQVASAQLTIYDDPTFAMGPRSTHIDDEGVPTFKKPIIEDGVLKSFLYDSYNANIANKESTGNGFRRGTRTIENAHIRIAACAPSNIVVKPGKMPLEELIADTKKGILIEKFAAPNADGITGNFGLEIRSALLIENGEFKKPIKHALLAGNFYDGLKNIEGIASESALIENVYTPAIKFAKFQVVGQ